MLGCLYHSSLAYRLSALIERTSTRSRVGLGHSSKVLWQVLLSMHFFPIGVQVQLGAVAMQKIHSSSAGEKLIEFSENFLSCAVDLIASNGTSFRTLQQVPVIFRLSYTAHLRPMA